MAQRKGRDIKRKLSSASIDDEEDYIEERGEDAALTRERRRSHVGGGLKFSRKKQDMLVLLIAIILIISTLSVYYYIYGLSFYSDSEDANEESITGNFTGEIYVISDITNNWEKNSWHTVDYYGYTNFMVKIINTGDNEDTFVLTDNNTINTIQINYDKNNIILQPGQSTLAIIKVSTTMEEEYRVPKPIDIEITSKTISMGLDFVQLYLTIDNLDEDKVAISGDIVSAFYSGAFENGTLFDYSLKDPNKFEPLHISLSNSDQLAGHDKVQYARVIPGFKDGIIGMLPGETHVITVPPELGYEQGELSGKTLFFQVRLLSNDRDY